MKKLILSKRMEAVAGLVPPQSSTVADVGCDHAYVSIKIINDKLANKVIAMDLRKGPLEIAQKNIREFEVEKQIETRLSDGLEKLLPMEADVIIIAGMGGLLMCDILKRGIDILKVKTPPTLVLQPQSDIKEVRTYLYDNSYNIVRETMVLDNGKTYTAILAVPGNGKPYDNDEDWIYGKYNIDNKSKVLSDQLINEEKVYRSILASLETNVGSTSKKRISEINEYLNINLAAQKRFLL